MKDNSTFIGLLIDKSGSMESVKSDTIGGINSFLDEQSKVEGKCKVSLYQFDDQYEITYENADITIAPRLNTENYKTRGWTALLDAIGKTINNIGDNLSKLNSKDRPSKVILVIESDGQENHSKEFTKSQIEKMIKHQTEKYNWSIVFLGANMDAISVAKSYGINANSTITYSATSIGKHNLYNSLSDNMTKFRSSSDSYSFSQKDRDLQEEQLTK